MTHRPHPRPHRRLLCALHPGTLVAALGLFVGGTAAADTPVIDVFEPVADTTIFDVGEVSNGAGPRLFVGVTNASGGFARQRSPMRFDLSAIPADATILEVTLTVTLQQAGGQASAGDLFRLRRVLAPWGEAGSVANGGQGAPAQVGDATWSSAFFPRTPWATPGGDLAASPSAELGIGVDAGTQWTFADPQLAADVIAWVTEPGENHGWVLMGDESQNGTARRFVSREGAAEERPMLSITWIGAPFGCAGDLDGSGAIDFGDLLAVLASFGDCDGCPEDLDASGSVDFTDLLTLLANFGGCVG